MKSNRPAVYVFTLFCIIIYMMGFFAGRVSAAKLPPESLSTYATEIVGAPTTVKCQKMPEDYFGYTEEVTDFYDDGHTQTYYAPMIYLSLNTCQNLRSLRRGQITSYFYQANAIETLIHEAYHIRFNSGDEGKTECRAMANLWNYIVAYGFGPRVNKQLYAKAWAAHLSLSGEYLGNCPPPANIAGSMGPLHKAKPLPEDYVEIG